MVKKNKARKSRPSNEGEVRVHRTIPEPTVQTSSGMEIEALRVTGIFKPFQGFIDFVREQGVVGLAVGFIVGTSAAVLVKSIVTNLINPVIGLVTGGIDLSHKTVCLNTINGVCKNTLNYGQFLSDLITFILILGVVYFVIKSLRLEKLDKPKPEKK